MGNLSINGVNTGGQVYELKLQTGQTIHSIKSKGLKDGLDQVFFKAGDKHYLAQGDGLDLSGFEKGIIPEAVMESSGKLTDVQILSVDNEVNTAWEGVKHVGKVSLALATGGVLGSSIVLAQGARQMLPAAAMVSEGVGLVKIGFIQFKAGMIPAQQGMHGSIDAIQKLIGTGEAAAPVVVEKSGSWVGRIVDKVGGIKDKAVDAVGKVHAAPGVAKEVGKGLEMIQKGSGSVQEGLVLTEQAVTKFDGSVALVEKSTPMLKKGLYIAGIALAVAGTVAAGGAIYGATRGQREEDLAEFRGPKID